MYFDKKTKENMLVVFAVIFLGFCVFAISNTEWFMSLPDNIRNSMAVAVGIGIFFVPAWLIATVVVRVQEYRKNQKRGTFNEAAANNAGVYQDAWEIESRPAGENAPAEDTVGMSKTGIMGLALLAVVGTAMIFGFSQAAIDSGGGAAWLLLLFPLLVWLPVLIFIFNRLTKNKRGISADSDAITVRYLFKKPKTIKYSDIVAVNRIYAAGQEYRESFSIKTKLDESISVESTASHYEPIRERLELEVPHLCFWMAQAESFVPVPGAQEHQAAQRQQPVPQFSPMLSSDGQSAAVGEQSFTDEEAAYLDRRRRTAKRRRKASKVFGVLSVILLIPFGFGLLFSIIGTINGVSAERMSGVSKREVGTSNWGTAVSIASCFGNFFVFLLIFVFGFLLHG